MDNNPAQAQTVHYSSTAKHDIHKFRTVTKLTDENWIEFKFEIIAALAERDLLDVVTGKFAKPNDVSDPKLYAIWNDKDVSANAQLIQNISKDVQPIVYDCKTSAEVWSALKDEFESKNLDKLANVRLVYDTLAFVEGTPMRDHINKLKILRERLAAMGDEISDLSHALRLIRLLPPTWEAVGQVLRANEPTVAKVKDRLLAEEQYRKTSITFANAGNASALLASIPDPATRSQLQALLATQFGSVLLNPGHAMNSPGTATSSVSKNGVPLAHSNQYQSNKLRNPNLTCSNPNCGRQGHTIESCWAKGGHREGKGPKQSNGARANSNSDLRGGGADGHSAAIAVTW
jgi:hypothetical protein